MSNEIEPLSEQELERLRDRLTEKLQNLSHLYQSKSHKRFYSTEWEKKRKEDLERQIALIKTYLEKLSKPYVFVDVQNKFFDKKRTYT